VTDSDYLGGTDDLEQPAPVQVDLYGIKLRSSPSPTKDASSRITLTGLRDDVWQSILRICRDSVGFVADVFTSARSIIRGIATVPAAVASRIRRAHDLSEKREGESQQNRPLLEITQEAKAESVEALSDLLGRLRAQGVPLRLGNLPSGHIVISIVQPDIEDTAPELAADAITEYLIAPPRGLPDGGRIDVEEVLNTPVADFELSVRSRNCLKRMGVATLGDLCRFTEQDLLSRKDLGESGLIEIKETLASEGLKLGLLAPERHVNEMIEPQTPSPEEQTLPSRPISDLNLSVRARRCMIRLGITTLGELVRRTGDDLLECKNFGTTSLNEVREKLASLGLKLRGD
jgi:hypothetical protein